MIRLYSTISSQVHATREGRAPRTVIKEHLYACSGTQGSKDSAVREGGKGLRSLENAQTRERIYPCLHHLGVAIHLGQTRKMVATLQGSGEYKPAHLPCQWL
ncbi:hypothetical protein IF1G_00705 [Cordyceps javanica]|uniref:Uncharacterized protein n=1 Tax=Cordyceps javanica TaxID=43265 RepID=A0A545VGB7_9HYPO|nr:hypothetical protein IF1G_00705 [Cordyceps javanica]